MVETISETAFLAGLTHLPGRVRLAYSSDGDRIYTGSSGDNIVRAHDTTRLLTSEPRYLEEVDRETEWLETSAAEAASGLVLVSSIDGVVRKFTFDRTSGDHAFQGIVTRAGGVPSRCMAIDGRGERVAVCSDEITVKVLSISDPTQHVALPPPLSGSRHHVRSCSWNPARGASGSMLSVILSDGSVAIYELLPDEIDDEPSATATGIFDDDDNAAPPAEPKKQRKNLGIPTCIKTIEALVPAGRAEDETPCLIAWHPSGDFFVAPSRAGEIALIDRDSWQRRATFSQDGHDGAIGLLRFSPNGKYLVSCGSDGQMIVWLVAGRKPVTKTRVSGGVITDVRWHPHANALAYATADGAFYVWEGCIPAEMGHPATVAADKQRAKQRRENGGGGENLFDDAAADDGEEKLFDDEDDEDAGDDVMDEYDDDWIIDADDGDGLGYKAGGASKSKAVARVREYGEGPTEVVSVTTAQPPFQPGSTAMKDKRRYLAFNMIGVVEVTDMDTHHVVNVDFHDREARRAYHFQDPARFHLASVGEHGVAYASEPEDGRSATISYRAYDAWASQSDWQTSLPEGEQAVCVAVGGRAIDPDAMLDGAGDAGMGTVVVATNKGVLRFFTGSGLQRYLWKTGDEIVTVVASTAMLFVAHRDGGTSLDGCQNLRYSLIHLDDFDVVQEGRMPLPKRTTLKWVGFAENGSPVMLDSAGQISLLDRFKRQSQARWVPLLDTVALAKKKGRSESYWPVGVTDKHLMCLVLRGGQSEPSFPRPLVMEEEITLPTLNLDAAQGQAEERFLRTSLHLGTLQDTLLATPASGAVKKEVIATQVAQDKELLQMMQTACQADKLQRALDLARLLHLPATLEAAIKLAGFYRFPGLQEKIRLVKEARFDGRGRERSEKAAGFIRNERLPFAAGPSTRVVAQAVDDFAPRPLTNRRTAPARVAVEEDSDRSMSYIPDTPQETRTSPPPGRKRSLEDADDEGLSFEPAKRPAGVTAAHRNPFARREQAKTANPFARTSNGANGQPLGKSTSFFERVDDIEGNAEARKKPTASKQATLKGMLPVKPKAAAAAVVAIAEPEDDPADGAASPEAAGSDDEMGSEDWPESGAEDDDKAVDEETLPAEPSGVSKLAKFRAVEV